MLFWVVKNAYTAPPKNLQKKRDEAVEQKKENLLRIVLRQPNFPIDFFFIPSAIKGSGKSRKCSNFCKSNKKKAKEESWSEMM